MRFFLFFTAFFFSFAYAYKANPSYIDVSTDLNSKLGTKFQILQETGHNIDEVLNISNWDNIYDDIPNLGYMKKDFWLKSTIKNTKSGYYIFSIETSLIDYIDIYLVRNKVIEDIHLSGDLRKLSIRTIPHRYTLVPINFNDKPQDIEIYIKLQSSGSIQIPMYIKEHIQSGLDLSTSSFLHGLFGGLILIMVIYNMCLFVAFKETSYLFFVLFATFTLLFQYAEYGFATEYTWGEYPVINSFLIPILIPLILMFMSLFLGSILNVKRDHKITFKLLVLLFTMNFLIFIGALLFEYNLMCELATYAAIITNPCHLIIALIYAKKGDLSVKMIALSLLSFVLGLILFSFEKLGLISSTFITANSLKFGQALEILFISIALSFKINKLVHQASHDKLTGVPNRLGFDIKMKESFEKSQIDNSPLSLLMLDVDKFKSINDRFGHDIGDKVLIHISSIIKNVMTKHNVTVFRYGGEEFSVILSGKTSSNAVSIAEEIRKEIEKTPFHFNSAKKTFTISIGCGHYNGDNKTMHYEDLIKHADKLLYEAKNTGRNKIVSGHLE